MNRVPVFFILAALFTVNGLSQNSVTLKSDPENLSRPVATLLNQLRQREKIAITYEDPRYSNSVDIKDVTAKVSRGSELEKKYGPRILVPRGHAVIFVYEPTDIRSTGGAKATIERMLREYASLGGPAFTVKGDDLRLHVVPSEVLNAAGDQVKQVSILDTVISVPPAQRDGGEMLQAICDQIKKQTGYELGIGPSVPGNNMAQYQTTEGIENQSAREAVERLLDKATFPGSFVWDLYYDPGNKSYGFNFSYVGSAGPVPK